MSRRAARVLPLPVLALVLVLVAGAAASPPSVRVATFPKRALQGSSASVAVVLRRQSDRCTLAVRYRNGAAQPGLRAAAVTRGVARWTWDVPKAAPAGAARATIACRRSGRVTRQFVVVGAVQPPTIAVTRQGFSIRSRSVGSEVSFGVLLANESQTLDALGITVLVNFVDPSNVLYGSKSMRVKAIAAGGEFAVGGSLSFPGAAPVARLEVVVQAEGHRPRAAQPAPALANLRLLPGRYEPQWLGSLEGELVNDEPALTLERASLSAVVFDAAGNVVGGGSGSASASLPPGTRQFFKASTGLSAIPITNAVSARVSIEPSYLP